MTWFAIGTPGHAPRIIFEPAMGATPLGEIGAGEVAVIVDGPGIYVINADGLSAAPAIPSLEELTAEVRATRDRLLTASDKYMLPDYPIAEDVRASWAAYRQALRDLPENQPAATLETVEWPVAPVDPSAPKPE